MIRHTCPSCEHSLQSSDDLAGMPIRCPECRQPLEVPRTAATGAAPQPTALPEPPPLREPRPPLPPPPPAQPSALRRLLARYPGLFSSLFLLAVLLLIGGAVEAYRRHFANDVVIFVDNDGQDALVVSIDGSKVATVPPLQHAAVKCRSGQRQVQATHGGNVLFDQRLELARKEYGGPTKYLFNPGGGARYWRQEISYGLSLPKFEYRGSGLLGEYSALARRPDLLPPAEWQELTLADFVLEPAPATVKGNVMDTKYVLARLSRDDYDFIQAARKNDRPTDADLTALKQRLDRLSAAVEPANP
jgi:hypothetical protein